VGRSAADVEPRFLGALSESAHVLAGAMGLEVTRVDPVGQPVLATTPTEIGGISVAAGGVCGFDQGVVAHTSGGPPIELQWLGIPKPGDQGVSAGADITLTGRGDVVVSISVDVPLDPYPGTAARMVKAATALRSLPGGLHSPTALAL
jgi:hypothetical protein